MASVRTLLNRTDSVGPPLTKKYPQRSQTPRILERLASSRGGATGGLPPLGEAPTEPAAREFSAAGFVGGISWSGEDRLGQYD